MQTISVPQMAWHGPCSLDLPLPENWQVETCYMAGYQRTALTPDQIREGLLHPIDMPPIHEAARRKKEAVILFDDLTRITRAAKIVPYILEELAAAGIPEDNIRFICSLGLHGVMNRSDFAKKLGYEVVSRWEEVLELLRSSHGPDTRAAVIPDTTNQYFAWYD